MKYPGNSNFDNDKQLGDHIRNHATRFDASKELRASIRTQLTLKVEAQAVPNAVISVGGLVFSWPSATAGLICGVLLSLTFGLVLAPQIEALMVRPSFESSLVARHVYSMGQGRLFEVASSDRHTIKPWFQGKLDFSPPVLDMTSAGFTLQGGRVDYIDDRAVAALTYVYKQHIVNAFVWPSQKARAPETSTSKGFNLLHWDDGEMQIWLVSDVDTTELNRFSQTWRTQVTNPSLVNH